VPDSATVEERLRKMFLFSVGVLGSTRVRSLEAGASLSRESELDVDDVVIFTIGVTGRDAAALDSGEPINCTPRRAVKISSSVKIPKGSRLLRIVPVNKVGSRK